MCPRQPVCHGLGKLLLHATQFEEETSKAPPNGLTGSNIQAYRAFPGNEGRVAVIYGFKCQIGLKSGLQLDVAVTSNRVWFGGMKKGTTEVVQLLDMPFSQLQFIHQESKNTLFYGAVSKITLKWVASSILPYLSRQKSMVSISTTCSSGECRQRTARAGCRDAN